MCKRAISSIFTLQLSRNQRFSASFHHTVETLVNLIMPHITQKYKDNLDAARNANHSLAVFIKVRSCSCCLFHLFPGHIFKDLFCPLAAMFQPDGQRVRVQTNQQLHELFHAWRPKGRPAVTRKLFWIRAPAGVSLCSAIYLFLNPDIVWVQVWVPACCLQPWALCPSEPAHAVWKGPHPEISRWEDQFRPDGGCLHCWKCK